MNVICTECKAIYDDEVKDYCPNCGHDPLEEEIDYDPEDYEIDEDDFEEYNEDEEDDNDILEDYSDIDTDDEL